MGIEKFKISIGEINANGVQSAQDDLTGTPAQDVKKIFDKLPILHINKSNQLIDCIKSIDGASSIGTSIGKTVEQELREAVKSGDVKFIRINLDNQLETSIDGITYTATGSSGHLILNVSGEMLPQRSRLKFGGCVEVVDDSVRGETIVTALKGDKGDKGDQGIQGIQGIQGEIGRVFIPSVDIQGNLAWELLTDNDQKIEPRNIKGPQGVQGVQGVRGIQGEKGVIGPQGVQGVQGVSGSKGEIGLKGDKGDRGIQGIQGIKGDKGDKGDKGNDGGNFSILGIYDSYQQLITAHPTGNLGDAWAVGTEIANVIYNWNNLKLQWDNLGKLQGPQGTNGLQGEQGIQGANGDKGDKGDIGAKGEQGIQGIQGVKGDQGEQGIQGVQGEQGIQGTQGSKGLKGDQGNPTIINEKSGASITLNAEDVGADVQGSANTALISAQTYTNTELAKAKVYTLTHTKTGTIHTLTGLPTTSGIYSCVFKAIADFTDGDTFAGGYIAKPNGEETTLTDKVFISGDLVSIAVDATNKKIGFSVGFTGGEMNKPLIAGGELLNTLSQVRNTVYYPIGTDPNSIDVPIGTEIAIMEE